MMTVLPAASAAATPPHGMATGKFHGGTTTTTPFGRAASVGICCHPARRVAVELQEVDRFGHLRSDSPASCAVGERRAHQVTARDPQLLRDLAEQLEALRDRHRAPAVGSAAAQSAALATSASVAWR